MPHRATSTTLLAQTVVGLFGALLACAVVPANAVADPAAAKQWMPVSDGWDSKDVATLEKAFSAGRAGDASVTDKSFKVGKTQTEWDAMDPQQRALIVLNIERTARGLLPVSAVVAPLKTVAEDYAAYLKDKASPAGKEGLKSEAVQADWTASNRASGCCTFNARIAAQPSISSARDGSFPYGEALAWASVTSDAKMTDPFTWALYNWIYDDATASWGHRKFLMASYDLTATGKFGKSGAEGLVGFGKSVGTKGMYVVMNAVDQTSGWSHCNDIYRWDGTKPAQCNSEPPGPPGAATPTPPAGNPPTSSTPGAPVPETGAPGAPIPSDKNGPSPSKETKREPLEYDCDEVEKDGEMSKVQVFVMTAAFLLPLGFIFGAYYIITLCQVARLDLDGAMSPEILSFTGYDQKPKKGKGGKGKAKGKGKDVEAGKKKGGKKKAASSSSSSSGSDSSSDSD